MFQLVCGCLRGGRAIGPGISLGPVSVSGELSTSWLGKKWVKSGCGELDVVAYPLSTYYSTVCKVCLVKFSRMDMVLLWLRMSFTLEYAPVDWENTVG